MNLWEVYSGKLSLTVYDNKRNQGIDNGWFTPDSKTLGLQKECMLILWEVGKTKKKTIPLGEGMDLKTVWISPDSNTATLAIIPNHSYCEVLLKQVSLKS